jgi:hypothetical protein
MGNSLTNYNFDTNGKFVSGIAKAGTEEESHIVGFYVSDFGQTSEYLYQARIVDSVLTTTPPNADLNIFFPPGWFLSGVENYTKSTQGDFIKQQQTHYIITDGYNRKVGYIHYQKYSTDTVLETVENSNKFSCSPGEYLTNQSHKEVIADQVRTVIHDYKCSAGGPRPIPSSNVDAAGVIGRHVVNDVAFDTKKVKQPLQLTTILLFLVIVYAVVWVSSFSAVLGTTGNAVGGTVTDSGELFDNMIASSGEMAGGMIGNAGDMVGGMISGAGRMLGGAIGGTTDIVSGAIGGTTDIVGGAIGGTAGLIGGAIGGTAGLIGGAIGGTSQAVGGAIDGVVGGATSLVM